jgi:Holliday junction resolvasome RuvABC endonuclease subunit
VKATDPRVVGLDLSLTSSGVAHIDGTPQCLKVDDLEGMDRIGHITGRIAPVVPADTELVMVEAPVFVAGHMASALETAYLNGIVRQYLWHAGVAYLDVAIGTLKVYATGDGHAKKLDMIRAAEKRLGYEGDSDDEADALWLRALGWGLLGVPLVELPKTHTRALDKLRKARPVLGATR